MVPKDLFCFLRGAKYGDFVHSNNVTHLGPIKAYTCLQKIALKISEEMHSQEEPCVSGYEKQLNNYFLLMQYFRSFLFHIHLLILLF